MFCISGQRWSQVRRPVGAVFSFWKKNLGETAIQLFHCWCPLVDLVVLFWFWCGHESRHHFIHLDRPVASPSDWSACQVTEALSREDWYKKWGLDLWDGCRVKSQMPSILSMCFYMNSTHQGIWICLTVYIRCFSMFFVGCLQQASDISRYQWTQESTTSRPWCLRTGRSNVGELRMHNLTVIWTCHDDEGITYTAGWWFGTCLFFLYIYIYMCIHIYIYIHLYTYIYMCIYIY